MDDQNTPRIDPKTFEALFLSFVPDPDEFPLSVEEITYGSARVRLAIRPSQLRMGNTVSGPTLFALADVAFFAAVLSVFGPEREALTTDMSIRFLSRPSPVDTIAEARVLRAGRRNASGEVTLYSDGQPEPVAKCLGGYAVVGVVPDPSA